MKATPESLRKRCDTALQSLPDAPYRTMLAALFGDLLAEVERLAAQSAPTEIHADTPRHELLPRLRRLASDFQSHPLSRSISECEEAGIAMAEAAKQIEMLCRTRNTVVNHSGRMRKEIAALTEHRDFLLREIAKIDGDPGNACHYAIEAISAVCADLAEPVPPLPEPEPTYTDDLELRDAEACKERDHLRTMLARSVLADRAAAQVEPVRMLTEDELHECCGGCTSNAAIKTWMRRAVADFCLVNRGRVIPADGEVRNG